MKNKNHFRCILIVFALTIVAQQLPAQLNVEGDFRIRWVSDNFTKALDDRAHENYISYLSRIRATGKVGRGTSFHTEVINMSDKRVESNIGGTGLAGTGFLRWSISTIYAQLTEPNFLIFDVVRFRAGRQQFPIGNGLSLGESWYYIDKFDGGRIDLAYKILNLSLFGAITGQNLSATGLYPEPGSDQLYVARLGTEVLNQSVMSYFISHKLRGSYNDSYIFGLGSAGAVIKDLDYSGEFAYQKFNTAPGLSTKAGIGYMGTASYRWAMGPFRVVKFETRYAAYQGDDAKTKKIEQFSPPYPSFFWGERTGYANGEIGGTFPYKTRNLEGVRIWYSRIYFTPKLFPDFRLQFQYLMVKEYNDNDGYNTFDDEYSIRLYYTISKQSQLQFRFTQSLPNEADKDLSNNGIISSSEDRTSRIRFMVEWQIKF
jgi:hypothetical protein